MGEEAGGEFQSEEKPMWGYTTGRNRRHWRNRAKPGWQAAGELGKEGREKKTANQQRPDHRGSSRPWQRFRLLAKE